MWQHNAGGGPAAGLKLSEDNNQVVVASADGNLHVLEVSFMLIYINRAFEVFLGHCKFVGSDILIFHLLDLNPTL
jgi:hypothetical protein